MLLQYKNLTVRNAEAADAPTLAAWWNDGAVMAHAGFPKGLGITSEEIAASLAADTDLTRRRLILEEDGRPIGEMGCRNAGDGAAEIGIKICDFSRQEKGIGKIALSMLLTTLFHDLGYKTVMLDTNLNNRRAQHVYERLGFRRTAVRRDAWTDQLGRPQSAVDYVLTPETFVSFLQEEPGR